MRNKQRAEPLVVTFCDYPEAVTVLQRSYGHVGTLKSSMKVRILHVMQVSAHMQHTPLLLVFLVFPAPKVNKKSMWRMIVLGTIISSIAVQYTNLIAVDSESRTLIYGAWPRSRDISYFIGRDCLSGLTPHSLPCDHIHDLCHAYICLFLFFLHFTSCWVSHISVGYGMQTKIKRKVCGWRSLVRSPLRVASPLESEIPAPTNLA